MFCTKCGNPVPDDANFCMKCGTPVAVAQTNPVNQVNSPAPVITYAPPVLQDGKILIPVGRKYRFYCSQCHRVFDGINSNEASEYACPVCHKADSFMGQVLIYRTNYYPLYAPLPMNVYIDGLEYGSIANQDSVRILLSPGQHLVCCGNAMKKSTQFAINITPESINYAFKFILVFHGPFTYPGRGIPMDFKPCSPEEIPNI